MLEMRNNSVNKQFVTGLVEILLAIIAKNG